MLRRFISNVARGRPGLIADADDEPAGPRVLNVGGADKRIAIPGYFDGWVHHLLDIAPGPNVDVVLDARRLIELAPAQYDAIYCSHNLEHYYRHDCTKVLAGFAHVLKPDGFVDVRVPDMSGVFRALVERDLDIDDVLYVSGAGPITAHDVVYGWGQEIERSGVDFYAHKRGFTIKSLGNALGSAGFATLHFMGGETFEIRAFGFKLPPSEEQATLLGLSENRAAVDLR